jgi:hypothetical protein
MKPSIMVGLLFVLTACDSQPTKQALDECWYEAIKVYPSEAFLSDKTLNLVPMCILARGYKFRTGAPNCDLGKRMLDVMNPACYGPENSN